MTEINTNKIFDILTSKERVHADFPGDGRINDILNFGFSFIESQDHFVEYIVAHPLIIKEILKEIPESKLDPTTESIGKIWTADLLSSKKMRENRIAFSNGGSTAVLFLNINLDKIKKIGV